MSRYSMVPPRARKEAAGDRPSPGGLAARGPVRAWGGGSAAGAPLALRRPLGRAWPLRLVRRRQPFRESAIDQLFDLLRQLLFRPRHGGDVEQALDLPPRSLGRRKAAQEAIERPGVEALRRVGVEHAEELRRLDVQHVEDLEDPLELRREAVGEQLARIAAPGAELRVDLAARDAAQLGEGFEQLDRPPRVARRAARLPPVLLGRLSGRLVVVFFARHG